MDFGQTLMLYIYIHFIPYSVRGTCVCVCEYVYRFQKSSIDRLFHLTKYIVKRNIMSMFVKQDTYDNIPRKRRIHAAKRTKGKYDPQQQKKTTRRNKIKYPNKRIISIHKMLLATTVTATAPTKCVYERAHRCAYLFMGMVTGFVANKSALLTCVAN